ncbi:hypothetical protein [Candidatus Odyssella thessalonicensis]|uniref:hypothetical protein n=1 Tax=Candidatus Odyssella thessalonicensis TaxID=84647 RepID=UPI000225BFC4|nr:hypothetical protein [Candidatus Odyssella thessalonicensis]
MKVDLRTLYENLSFIMDAKYSGTIHFPELIEWLYRQIKIYSDLPTFMYDLIDSHEEGDIFRRIPLPHSKYIYTNLSNSEHRALIGIAYKRGLYTKEDPCDVCTEKTALKNLEKNPHILERFKQTFPFIKLEWGE